MKKIIIAAALLLSTGFLPSCTKQVPVKTAVMVEQSTIFAKKDVGTAD